MYASYAQDAYVTEDDDRDDLAEAAEAIKRADLGRPSVAVRLRL